MPQALLCADNHPGFIFLQFEHPLQRDRAVAVRKISKIPGVVLLNSIHLLLHRDMPGYVAFRLGEEASLAIVHEVQLCLNIVLHPTWYKLITEDAVDRVVG